MLFNTENLHNKYRFLIITERPVSPQDSAKCVLVWEFTKFLSITVVKLNPAVHLNPASTQREANVPKLGPEELTGFPIRLTTLLFITQY